MAKSKYNSSGSGPKPSLGRGKPHGLAGPGGANRKPGGAGGTSVNGKVARPGGATKAPSGAGRGYGSVARPGGAQSISR